MSDPDFYSPEISSASDDPLAAKLAVLMPGLRGYVASLLAGYDRVDDVVCVIHGARALARCHPQRDAAGF